MRSITEGRRSASEVFTIDKLFLHLSVAKSTTSTLTRERFPARGVEHWPSPKVAVDRWLEARGSYRTKTARSAHA